MFGVIFDMDGTLVDSTTIIPKIVREVAGTYGLALTSSELRETTHFPFTVWVGNWNQKYGLSIDVKEVIQKYAVIEKQYLEHQSILSPGVDELVKDLHSNGARIGIATSAPRARLDNILSVSSIGHFFDATVSVDDVVRAKPDPEPYLKAAHALGVSPSLCVGIEDTSTGLSSAMSAGMKAIGYATTPESVLSLAKADLVVSHFSDLSTKKIKQLLDL